MKSPCTHQEHIIYRKYNNCIDCGVVLDGSCFPIKDNTYDTYSDVSVSKLYLNMLKDQQSFRLQNTMTIYIEHRSFLISWLKELNDQLHLSKLNLHIAVFYMDYALGQFSFARCRFELIALTCLILAVKYNEVDHKIPFLNDFLRVARTNLPLSRMGELKKCETEILKLFNWNLKVVTSLNFAELLLVQGVVDSSDLTLEHTAPTIETAKMITKYTLEFIDKSLECTFNCFHVRL